MSSPQFSSFPFDGSFVDNYSHPLFINANRAPTDQDIYAPGTFWQDSSASPKALYQTTGGGVWQANQLTLSTDGTFASPSDSTASSSLAIKTYVDATASFGAPIASEITQGIGFTASEAQVIARQANDATHAYFVSPEDLDAMFASIGAPIGSVVPNAGTFTDLTADGTGAVSLTGNAASTLTNTAGDLTIDAQAGSLVLDSGEAATADSVRIVASAADGGIDIDAGSSGITIDTTAAISLDSATASNFTVTGAADLTLHSSGGAVNVTSGEANTDSLNMTSAGGVVLTATGAAGKDIVATCTNGSIQLVAGEAVSDAVNIDSSGGFDLDAAGQVNLRSTQNASDAIVVESTVGGVQILASGASAGEDIVLTATGSSITATATEDAALNIYLHANGGVSETIKIHSDQGTGASSIGVVSDVGGITVDSGLAGAASVRLVASNAAGGMDLDCGTGGFTLDSTGILSLDSAGATNLTATGAFDVTVNSTAGSVIINGEEAVADAIQIQSAAGGVDWNSALQSNIDSSQVAADAVRIIASNAAGGIDIDAGTGGIAVDSTGAISLGAAAASDFTVTGAFDLTLQSTLGSIVANAGEAAIDAIRIVASNAAGGFDFDCGTGGCTLDSTGAISIDAAAASNYSTSAGDLTIDSAAGSLILSSGEDVADSIQITADAGGIDITCSAGAAGQDIDLLNTGGSVNITATENVSDAVTITASGAASGMAFSCGTVGFSFDSGVKMNVTSVVGAGGATAVNGDDFILSVDTSGGTSSLTLPAAPSTGRCLWVMDTGGAAAANNITINGNGKNLIGGAAAAGTKVISANYAGAFLVYNGTNWNYRFIA